MEVISALLFCLSVSADSLAIGFSFGLRKFRPTAFTVAATGLTACAFSAVSLISGRLLSGFIPQAAGDAAGFLILAALGIYTILCGFKSSRGKAEEVESRALSIKQSVFLSLALSFDALGAGVGYSISGAWSLWVPPGVGAFHMLFLLIGFFISGKTAGRLCFSQKAVGILSGIIILGVAVSRFFAG